MRIIVQLVYQTKMLYLCLICLVSAYALPVSFDESENEIDNPDYDTFQNLQQLGDKLFGDPKNSSGMCCWKFITRLSGDSFGCG